MEIVININNSTYEAIKHEYCAVPPQKGLLKVLWDAIKNGTPLPKGHGRLIDVKQIVYEKDCVWESDGCCTTISTPDIDATPTIIEADKALDQESVLDKIEEEIKDTLYVDSLIFGELIDFKNGKIDADDVIEEFNRVTRMEVLKIIDKYKLESEV